MTPAILNRRPLTPKRMVILVGVAIVMGYIIGGASYALIAGFSAALGVLIVAGIRRVS